MWLKVKSFLRYGFFTLFVVFTTYSCIPWARMLNVCVPLSDTHGIPGIYGWEPDWIDFWIWWYGEGFDEAGQGALYRVQSEDFRTLNEDLWTMYQWIHTPPPHDQALFGNIYVMDDPDAATGWKRTLAYHYYQVRQEERHFTEMGNGIYWSQDTFGPLKSYLLFAKLPPAGSDLPDWNYYIGSCPYLPDQAWRIEDGWKMERRNCRMEFYHEGLSISYSIPLEFVQHYRQSVTLIKNHVLCTPSV